MSFPRSGHHAMMGFMKRVSDLADDYCEFYNCKTHDGKAIDCPKKLLSWRLKGQQCGAGRRVTKTHDFDLALPIRRKWKYVVQYRHPVPAIQSWYELESRKKNLDAARFARESLRFWKAFMEKWVFSLPAADNVLRVNYDTLARVETLREVAGFCQAQLDIPRGFSPNFALRRSTEEIPPVMQRLEQEIVPLLERAGIERMYSHSGDSSLA